jgi:hypothetical protein
MQPAAEFGSELLRMRNLYTTCELWSRDCSVGIATMLRAWRSGVRVPAGTGEFSLSRPVLVPTQLSVQWLPGVFLGVKATGAHISVSVFSLMEEHR